MKKITEEWKDIVEYQGSYQISNLGRVKSLARYVKSRWGKYRLLKERILKSSQDKDGYFTIGASFKNKPIHLRIHRLVAKAFVPNPSNKPEVNHKDCNKQNNTYSNLEWVDDYEQAQHAWKMGVCLYPKGSKHGNSKLTEQDIPIILERIKSGEMIKDIAKDYNIVATAITRIKKGTRWNHVARPA